MKPRESSLIFILNEAIRDAGFITYQRMEQICKDTEHKVSNGERRLRRSESPNVEVIENERGAIIGYKYLPPVQEKTGKVNISDKGIERLTETLFPYPSLNTNHSKWRE